MRTSRARSQLLSDAEVVDQLDGKRWLRDVASVDFLHSLDEPAADLRIGRDEALVSLGVVGLDVDDREAAAIRHLLMPDGLSPDPGVPQRGGVFLLASARHLGPRLAITILL